MKRFLICALAALGMVACVSEDVVQLPKSEAISFADSGEIADYAKDAVYILAKAGIVSGNENSEFNPLANATRAEAAKILYYTMTLVK